MNKGVWFVGVVVLAFVLLIGAVFGIRVVDQSETCAVVKLGKVVGQATVGFHVVNPITTRYTCYPATAVMFQTGAEENKKADYWDYMVEIKTSDGQTGNISFNILYSVDPERTVYVRSEVAQNDKILNERVVANFSRSIPRNIAALYTADGLYATERAAYSQEVENELRVEFADYGVILKAFELRDVQFSTEYEAAIEQQQIAEEQIQTAEFQTEQKKQEAEQARIAAQGKADSQVIEAKAQAESTVLAANAEAEANRVISASLNDTILQYEYIKRLDVKTMLIPNSGDQFILPLPEMP